MKIHHKSCRSPLVRNHWGFDNYSDVVDVQGYVIDYLSFIEIGVSIFL
ncbi:MAG: hypothetical protein JEZ03_15145 [Bacteroidales bacterium]|nr:hypothetical protein [Bacteroidales bacterium]